MLNERFCSICEKCIKFNNKLNRHWISCDYAHEKKSSRFIFHDIYLKKKTRLKIHDDMLKMKRMKIEFAIIYEWFQNIKKEYTIHDEDHDNWWYSETQ